jgi:hypothetical protein
MSENIPIKERPKAMKIIDIILIVFFIFNFIFICYLFDIEQIIVLDHSTWGTPFFEYPAWPPSWIVDLNHWVGQFDPALLDRPAWWRATIWIDIVLFGPFYAVGSYAFIRGKKWIRIPTIMWATMMLTNVTIIMFSEFFDPLYAGNPYWYVVVSANAMWILMPILTLVRIIMYPTTFEKA